MPHRRIALIGLLGLQGLFASHSVLAQTTQAEGTVDDAIVPNLSIDIPGVTFTPILEREGVLHVSFLADYIQGAYLYLLGIGTTIAIVMVIIGGLRYTLSAVGDDVEAAKTMIRNALTGLVLLFSVFLILATINPNLTQLPVLEVVVIPEIEEEEDDAVSGTVATEFQAPLYNNIQGPGVEQVPKDMVASLEAAAETLAQNGYGMYITSSFRSLEKQLDLIKKNCSNPAGSSTCNPLPGRPTTCILRGLDPANCPHTTGRALDIWATKDGYVCLAQSQCSRNPSTDACRKNECQSALIEAMRAEGFCNLQSEAWHFEKPHMSSTCN